MASFFLHTIPENRFTLKGMNLLRCVANSSLCRADPLSEGRQNNLDRIICPEKYLIPLFIPPSPDQEDRYIILIF